MTMLDKNGKRIILKTEKIPDLKITEKVEETKPKKLNTIKE